MREDPSFSASSAAFVTPCFLDEPFWLGWDGAVWFSKIIYLLILNYVYVSLPLWDRGTLYMQVPTGTRGHWIPRNWNHRWLWATVRVLGTKSWSSARVSVRLVSMPAPRPSAISLWQFWLEFPQCLRMLGIFSVFMGYFYFFFEKYLFSSFIHFWLFNLWILYRF